MRALLLTASLVAFAVPAAADVQPCSLGGPAGTASVVRLDLPSGAPSLGLRITTPIAVGSTPSSVVGGPQSSRRATQVAVLRVRDGALVATRVVQTGSSPRRLVVDAGDHEVRQDLAAPGAPFTHTGGTVPDSLPPGSYWLVAYGTDGDAAVPNPTWSVQVDTGTTFRCVPAPAAMSITDYDQTDFHGLQVTGYGPGVGQAASLRTLLPHRHVVGFLDAQSQLAGNAVLTMDGPARGTARNTLVPFAGPTGAYAFTAEWAGAFPLVLVALVGFTPR